MRGFFQNNIFLKHLLSSLEGLVGVVKAHPIFISGLYFTIVGLSYLSHYVAYEPSFMVLSLMIPLILFFISFCIYFFSAFFILPYLFQKQFKSNHPFYLLVPSHFSLFFKQHISSWSKEMSKVFGVSYLWGLLLVVPGVMKFFRCSFVSYINLFSEDKTLPRKRSHQYTKGLLGRITFLCLLFIGGFYFLSFQLSPNPSSIVSVLISCMIKDAWFVFYGLFLSISLHLYYLKKEFTYRTTAPQSRLPLASGSDLSL